MSNILGLQNNALETPGTEKASAWSVAACRRSFKSYFACFQK